VIGIDDAHLLDEASAALLHQLAPDGKFFVLPPREPAREPDSVRVLWKDAGQSASRCRPCRRILGQLVSQALDGQVDGSDAGQAVGGKQG